MVGFVVWMLVSFLLAVGMWNILSRAGLRPSLSLLMFVPLVNVWIILYAAFSEWPALRRRDKDLEEEVKRQRMLLLDAWKEKERESGPGGG